jgi:hypothetical protein
MNTANYNWTESINRASEKPGEIQPATRPGLEEERLWTRSSCSKRLAKKTY